MTAVYEKITNSQTVLAGDTGSINCEQLLLSAKVLADTIISRNITILALLADNSPQWMIVDLACQITGCCFLPLPAFFSDHQIQHCLKETGCHHIMTDTPQRLSVTAAVYETEDPATGFGMFLTGTDASTPRLPKGTAKITFTSGSTGTPKGVCLDNNSQYQVADTLSQAINDYQGDHLCLLPLSTLLENVAGAYRSLLAGHKIHLPSSKTLGFNGTTLDHKQLIHCIEEAEPATLILVPELLKLLNTACNDGWKVPNGLQFVAVGGAKVSPQLLLEAQCNGLPVYEGYGLSECCSVISLNTPQHSRPGTAGKVLGHQSTSFSDGELEIKNQCFLGYVNEPESWHQDKVRTGDLGWIDNDGYLRIQGRKKNLMISSYGRNISPEWLESEILADSRIQQAVVFGDQQAFCSALIYANDTTGTHDIDELLNNINQALPDYARIQQWQRLKAPMTVEAGLYTANGRPKRKAIAEYHRHIIDSIYNAQDPHDNEVLSHGIL